MKTYCIRCSNETERNTDLCGWGCSGKSSRCVYKNCLEQKRPGEISCLYHFHLYESESPSCGFRSWAASRG